MAEDYTRKPAPAESLRFSYVRYDAESAQKQEWFKMKFEQLEEFAIANLPDSRERALFLTALEEAYMWTGKAIRNAQIAREMWPQHTPERG